MQDGLSPLEHFESSVKDLNNDADMSLQSSMY